MVETETGTVDESGLESLTDLEVDEKYEEDMRSIYDSEQETLTDLNDYYERMYIEDDEDARQYESDIEREEYQSELKALEADKRAQIDLLVYEAEQEELRSGITFETIHDFAKRRSNTR